MSPSADLPAYLVLDSTELASDWSLSGVTYRQAARIPHLRIAIPASVFVETVANHGRAVEEAHQAMLKQNNARRRLGLPAAFHPSPTTGYAELFSDALRRYGIVTLPWPEDSHALVVQRAADRVPPFDGKGGGYRDTLVWLSARLLVERGHTVYLATRDKAFRGEADQLCRELQSEVDELSGSLELITDLRRWVIDRVSPATEEVPAEDAAVDRELTFAEVYLGPWGYEDTAMEPASARLPLEASDATVAQVHDRGELQTALTRELPGGEVYVEFEQPLRVRLEAVVPAAHAQAQGWSHIYTSSPGMVDANWDASIIARFGVTFSPSNLELSDGEAGFAVEFVRYRQIE
ncbi:hypothetical protein GCM10028784_36910 [Myceligenerans cantabricum]